MKLWIQHAASMLTSVLAISIATPLSAQPPLVRLAPPPLANQGNPGPPAEAIARPPAMGDLDPGPAPQIPPNYAPYWQGRVLRPLRPAPTNRQVGVDSLVMDALRHSARVRAISDNPLIAQTAVAQAVGEFDARAFMESKFIRTSVPTGSDLDAGFNVPRLREEDWYYSGGARRKNRYGGRFEVAQKIGTKDSNSNFFTPRRQGNARLTLNYNHPLLNGAGQTYNNSLIVLACLDTRIATSQAAAELQDHLLEVTQSFWQLYLQRSLLLQKHRHLQRAAVILQRLERRKTVDALASQIARARSAVASRRSDVLRANTSIRNAEAQIRALVNAPDMLTDREMELIPIRAPASEMVPVDLQQSLVTALENRPEIDAAGREIEAARVRLQVAKNELLPILDVVLETYVSGLRGRYNLSRSFADQFSVGEPSYTAGLVFEVPLQRRTARAQHRQRALQLRQLSSQFQAIVATLHAEVEIAVREVETAHRLLLNRYQSMMAAGVDENYLQRRWERAPGADRAASFLLEDLLNAQDRLASEEAAFAQSQIDYTLSIAQLKRATGTLLDVEPVSGDPTSHHVPHAPATGPPARYPIRPHTARAK